MTPHDTQDDADQAREREEARTHGREQAADDRSSGARAMKKIVLNCARCGKPKAASEKVLCQPCSVTLFDRRKMNKTGLHLRSWGDDEE